MEVNRKKTNFKNEFAINFCRTYSKEVNVLEKSIHSSYDRIWNKFLTLVESSNFCKVVQINETRKPATNAINEFDTKTKKFDKLIESFDHAKISNKEINKPSRPVFRSERKNQTFTKPNDPATLVKAKKNLNFVNKTAKNEDFQLKMHPPLASSSIIVPRESERKCISPKIDSKHQLTDFSNINKSGKVKQIVEMVEARMKDSSKPTPSIASKLTKSNSNKQIQHKDRIGPRLSNKFKKKPGIIEQKKLRNSITNQEQKRKSIRKVNALLKDMNEDNGPSRIIKQDVEKIADTKLKQLAQTLNNKALKANIYKNEPKAHPASANLYNMKQKDKSNFAKFLERNTPIKLSRTELLAKEKREQERLNEREKLIHEKVEIAKKKREEKMKKIADLKHKNEIVVKKRQDEINSVKTVDMADIKKKVNETDKKSHECDKSKEINNKRAIKLPETMAGIVKNSPFQKLDKQGNKLNKENKLSTDDAEKTPKIKYQPSFNKNDFVKPQQSCTSYAKMNILKQISNLNEKKEPAYEDYGIQDLHSSDETDDEEEPSKPIPNWAKDPGFTKMAKCQASKFINFTKLFRSTAQININLDDIFEKKRKNFYQRTSSANWNSLPIWNTSGIHGNESFMQTHKN